MIHNLIGNCIALKPSFSIAVGRSETRVAQNVRTRGPRIWSVSFPMELEAPATVMGASCSRIGLAMELEAPATVVGASCSRIGLAMELEAPATGHS